MIVLLLHAAATWAMVGLIWFVQVVHYPLFADVDAAAFGSYHRRHMKRTIPVVATFMLIELLTAVWLVWVLRDQGGWVPIAAWCGLALVLVNAVVTATLSMPCHRRLSEGFDARCNARLVASNWLSTLAWSVRGIIALWLIGAVGAGRG